MLGGFVDSFRDVFESGIKIKQEGLDNANIINTYKLAAFHTTFNIMNVLIKIMEKVKIFTLLEGKILKLRLWVIESNSMR